jgi:hypothetical protein
VVFKNHGAPAGASLEHPHSQLIALPIVPDFAREELDGARRHYAGKDRCVFCDIVRQDLSDRRRVIVENADVVAVAPYAPRFAFETWLLPKRHGARFEEAPRQDYENLSRLLKSVLQRMERALESPALQPGHPQRAVRGRRRRRGVPLARGDHSPYHARRGVRVGDRLLHQPDAAGGSGPGAAVGDAVAARDMLQPSVPVERHPGRVVRWSFGRE